MRRIFRSTLAVALLTGVAVFSPQGARAVGPYGGGEVSGLVTLDPGVAIASNSSIPDSGCAPQSYTFGSVILNGTITDGSRTFAGSISTSNVKGQSTRAGGDCADIGVGTVNTSSDRGNFTSTTGGPNQVAGNFFGNYERHGTHVFVHLTGSVNFAGGSSYSGVPINLEASEFIPLVVNPATGRVTQAVFTGEFHIGIP